ncbi:MAG TPA: hypothetical protein PKK85_00575 [Methanobacteriaceae archaeon]|nr:hypothetical protein [Methanobacteriaceae archaeon]
MEYWLTQKKRGKKFSFQWIEVKGDKIRALHREYINNNRLDVEHGGRDKNLKKTLHKKTGLPEDEILEYLEELGLFIGENQHLLKVTNKRKGRDKPVGNRDKKEAVEDPVPGYLERALELIKSEDPLQEVTDYIGRNVKHDETLVKLALMVMASAYTPNPLNLALEGPQSEGKTYALVEASKVFPKGDVWNLAGMTPQVLTREHGVLMDRETGESLEPEIKEIKQELNKLSDSKEDKALKNKLKGELQEVYDRGVKVVNMEGKILLFLEAPNTETLAKLRPIMSHDLYEVEYKFVDKAYQNGPQVTMDAKIRGWPVFLYATADKQIGNLWEQIRSRFIVVSPEMTGKKYEAANKFTARKHGHITDPEEIRKEREEFSKCTGYILFLKNTLYQAFFTIHGLTQVPPEKVHFTFNPMAYKLEKSFPATQGQHMRDFKYFMALMDISSLFNLPSRPYLEVRGVPYWMVTMRDLKNVVDVFDKYHFFIKGSELPLRYFTEIIQDLDLTVESIEGDQGFKIKDLRKAFNDKGLPNSDGWIKENVLEPLEDLGLLLKGKAKADKRRKVYTPFKEKYKHLSSNEFLKISFSLDELKEKIEEIKNILTEKGVLGIKFVCKTRYPLQFKKVVRAILEDEEEDIDSFTKKVHSTYFSVRIIFSDEKTPDKETPSYEEDNLDFENKSLFFKGKESHKENLEEEIKELQDEALKGSETAREDMEARVLELDNLKRDEKAVSPRSFEDLQVEKYSIPYILEHPDQSDFNIVSRKVTEITGIDEPLVKESLRGLISGGLIRDRGDGNLEAVGGEK